MTFATGPSPTRRSVGMKRGCQVGRWIATLSSEEREAFQGWLDAPIDEFTHMAIATRVNNDPDYNVAFTNQAIGYHRNQTCSCGAL